MQLNVYSGSLAICSVITLLLTIKARAGAGGTAPLPAAFKRFQLIFLMGAPQRRSHRTARAFA